MRRHADVVEMLEDVFGDPVVEDALALDHLVLLGIVCSRVVLEVLDQRSRLGSLVKDLGLAFVDTATAIHGSVPWFVNVHLVPWFKVNVECFCPRLTNAGTRSALLAVASMVAT